MKQENKKILAKSDGTGLVEHSIIVMKIAVELYKQIRLEHDETIMRAIVISSLLHDIGKCTKFCQNKLNANKFKEDIEEGLKYRHNEISWGFLATYLNVEEKLLDIILHSTYWHHGISKEKMSKYDNNDVLIKLDKNDILTLIATTFEIISPFDKYIDHSIIFEKPDVIKAPSFYHYSSDSKEASAINRDNLIVRACVTTADRLASSLNTTDITNAEIVNLVFNRHLIQKEFIVKDNFIGSDRSNVQYAISSENGNTIQVNAPAGFGKTRVGLLKFFRRKKKMFWVCPRNMVAESVYKSILEELNNFGITNISVELYLTGELKESNIGSTESFLSDIIVTNIDNFLSPTVRNSNAAMLYSIIDCDVVFDEFHELVGEAALFACFINIMNVRNQLTNAHTTLLSATGEHIHQLFDSFNCRTSLLPGKCQHYPAQHNKSFKLIVTDNFITQDNRSNNLIVLNSIPNSQEEKFYSKAEYLIHSEFQDEDKKRIKQVLYDNYGKNIDRTIGKPTFIGTHIIQASLDVSFKNVSESVISPASTIQRSGRCDRFGNYEGIPTVNIAKNDNRGENAVREILYSKNLSFMWFDFIKQHSGKYPTIDQMYAWYNEYILEKELVLVRNLKAKYNDSLLALSKIFPIMFFKKGKNNVKTTGTNKLRSTNSEIFVIMEYHNDSNKFTDAISTTLYKNNFTEEFSESNIEKKLNKVHKLLRDQNDPRFDFNDMINNKNLTLDHIRLHGRKSNTPYIRFDKVYHPIYGVIDKERLNRFIKQSEPITA